MPIAFKKILVPSALVILVATLAIGATGAFFSDTETSTGNTFTAGDIDLRIDNESYVTDINGRLVASEENSWTLADLDGQAFFSFEDVKPGDIGEDTISIHPGTNDAYACVALDLTASPDNGINEPEDGAGDTTDGALGGELQNYVEFTFWRDDGDNVFEEGEAVISGLNGSVKDIFNGAWHAIADSGTGAALLGNSTSYIAKAWCFGDLTGAPVAQDGQGKTGNNGPLNRGTGFTCSGAGNQNLAQTDGLLIDASFYAVQARNNGQFLCASLPAFVGTSFVEVNQNSLATSLGQIVSNRNLWFFYNDTAPEGIMTIDQFLGSGGQNHMEAVDGSEGAKMVLHDALARYNIATYKYFDVKLADIGSLKYRIYDASASAQTPYLHFNVSFDGADTWQRRLVQVPTGVAEDTWTTVDALAGNWTYSGATWPAGIGEPGTTSGTTAKSWATILATYPNAQLRTTDSFFGVRVGHPGPAGEVSYVDWIEFDGETTDFEI